MKIEHSILSHKPVVMQKKLYLVAIVLLFISGILSAQNAETRNAISIRGLLINYDYPVNSDLSNTEYTGGAELEYTRHLNNVLNLAVPFKLGKGHLPINDQSFDRNVGLLSLDLLLQLKAFKGESAVYPYLFAGVGGVFEDMESFGIAAPVGLGLNVRLAPYTYFGIKGEYRVGLDDFRDNVQLGAGLTFLLGGKKAVKIVDRDGDGLSDEQDLCPDVPGRLSLNGCPDTDKDGIADGEDDCPTVAGIKAMKGCPDADNDGITDADDECPNERGLPENNGCPVNDADGDGIPDETDICPNEAGTEALNGCPDRDGDGLADREDACPDTPGPKASKGCPENDTDSDGVLDKDDRCPDSPGPASNQGCPEINEEVKEVLEFAMQAVQFETGRATLKSASYAVLDQIADILKEYSDYSLSIKGHTDSVGSSSKNQQLSERRAKACYDYFISKGIASGRMSYAGFGEKQPIADNMFKAGREKNRRVEFDVFLK